MNNPLLKYVSHPDKDEVFHSSAFARSQNSGQIGTASSETFAARRTLDQNRQFVKRYGDSQLGSATGQMHAKTYTPAAPTPGQPLTTRPMVSRPPMPKNPGINPGIHR